MGPYLNRFPLHEYHRGVHEEMHGALDTLFMDKDNHVIPIANARSKKELYKDESLPHRVKHLSAIGVRTLSHEFVVILKDIVRKERKAARTDSTKAAAQRRIVLQTGDGYTLSRVMHWLYYQKLVCEDADDLCRIRDVAEELRLTNLAQTCLFKLSASASAEITRIRHEGIDLCTVFAPNPEHQKPGAPFTFLRSVFSHVLNSTNSPEVLQDLLIDAITRERNSKLFKAVSKKLSSEMKDKLIVALFARDDTAY